MDSTYRYFLRHVIFNGYGRVNAPSNTAAEDSSDDDEEVDWRFIITNERLHELTKTNTISSFYQRQQVDWIAHLIRRENDNVGKILTFLNLGGT